MQAPLKFPTGLFAAEETFSTSAQQWGVLVAAGESRSITFGGDTELIEEVSEPFGPKTHRFSIALYTVRDILPDHRRTKCLQSLNFRRIRGKLGEGKFGKRRLSRDQGA